MNSPQVIPHVTSEGVAFSVVVEFKDHPCLVSKEALFELSRQDPNLDMLKAYKAYESKIQGIARRLVTAGVPGSPLVLQSKHF
jgi:hypothetical protein